MEVKGFNKKELENAFKIAPKILFEYVEAIFRVLQMSEQTNAKAIAKIRELSKLNEVLRKEYSDEKIS